LRKFMYKSALLLIALLPFFSAVDALELGEMQLRSHLNEPLAAQFKVGNIRGEDIGDLHFSLAGQSLYRKAGLSRPFHLDDLRFELLPNGQGEYRVELSTRQRIREPILDLLIQVEGMKGRLVRLYTLLLDHPGVETASSTATASTPSTQGMGSSALASAVEQGGQSTVSIHPGNPKPGQQTAESRQERSQIPKAGTNDPSSGPDRIENTTQTSTRSIRVGNDSLSMIAQNSPLHERYSVYQIMRAFYLVNPDAFLRGNINKLRSRSRLIVPDEALIAEVPRQQAVNFVYLVSRDLQEARAKPTVASSAADEVRPDPQARIRKSTSVAEPLQDEAMSNDTEESAEPGASEPAAKTDPVSTPVETIAAETVPQVSSALPVEDLARLGRRMDTLEGLLRSVAAKPLSPPTEVALTEGLDRNTRGIESLRQQVKEMNLRLERLENLVAQRGRSTEEPSRSDLSGSSVASPLANGRQGGFRWQWWVASSALLMLLLLLLREWFWRRRLQAQQDLANAPAREEDTVSRYAREQHAAVEPVPDMDIEWIDRQTAAMDKRFENTDSKDPLPEEREAEAKPSTGPTIELESYDDARIADTIEISKIGEMTVSETDETTELPETIVEMPEPEGDTVEMTVEQTLPIGAVGLEEEDLEPDLEFYDEDTQEQVTGAISAENLVVIDEGDEDLTLDFELDLDDEEQQSHDSMQEEIDILIAYQLYDEALKRIHEEKERNPQNLLLDLRELEVLASNDDLELFLQKYQERRESLGTAYPTRWKGIEKLYEELFGNYPQAMP